MSEWSERTNSRPVGTAQAERPSGLAKPVAAPSIVFPAGGGVALRPAVEGPVPFAFRVEVGDFASSALRTTGFDGYDIDLPPEVAAEAAPVYVEPVAPPVATTPVEIATSPAKVSIYEPLEIMDYEEFEQNEYIEPDPEPEPPAFLTETLPVPPFKAAVPAPAKPMAAFGVLAFADSQPSLIEASLSPVRPRMLRGPDPNAKPAPAPAPEPEPQVVIEPPKPAPQAAAKPAPVPDKPKVSVRPAPPPEKERRQQSRPPIAARDRGNAVPVEREEPQAAPAPPPPAPAPKPKVMPMPSRRPESAPAEPAVAPAAARIGAGPVIGLPSTEAAGMSHGIKMAIAGVVLAILGTGGYFAFGGKSEKSATPSGATASSLIVGGGGWTTTWGSDAGVNKNKQISIYRPSMAMTDYRFEFRGQIDRKALGWIFRASNSRNYYVMKLETIKPGANPLVALVKYAVIDGKETTKTQVMLPFDVKIDTLYQVRLDVSGDKFSTYVQDKLVDFWNDGRIKVGGAGFYSDAGERASIKSSQLSYLTTASAK